MASKAHVMGDPLEEATFQGPLISEVQMNRVLGYIESGVEEGARIASGGKRWGSEGYYVEPTVFVGVEPWMKMHSTDGTFQFLLLCFSPPNTSSSFMFAVLMLCCGRREGKSGKSSRSSRS